MRFRGAWLVLVVALAVTGCTAGGVVSVPQLGVVLQTHDDLTTDASAGAGTAYEIERVETRRIDNSPFGSYDTLRTDIVFAQAPVLPPAGEIANEGTELVFRIYFDTDQDDATGSWWNAMCGDDMGGAEFVVNATVATDVPAGLPAPVARLANGNYEVVDGSMKTGEASVAISVNTLMVSVPLSALGNDDGVTHLSIRVGNGGSEPASGDQTTDCAPNTAGFIVTGQGAAGR